MSDSTDENLFVELVMNPILSLLKGEKSTSEHYADELSNAVLGHNVQRNDLGEIIKCESIFGRILSTFGSSNLSLEVHDANGSDGYVNLYSLIWKKFNLCRRQEVLRMVS